ncbi:MAG: dTDP-4-dehydrorhamnose reductase, partial [Clostridium sp.]|nr:dTDP-4-dehydrorhamnose reductase [Clostridium sp.]
MKILITGSNGQLGNELQKIIATGTAEIGTVSDVI